MVLIEEFNNELAKCPTKVINTIKDIEDIRTFYFNVSDKYNLGYTSICTTFRMEKQSTLLFSCTKNKIFYLKFIINLDDADDYPDIDYNRYCYYNLTNFDIFIKNYNDYLNHNDTSFLVSWIRGDDNDLNIYEQHLKYKNITFNIIDGTIMDYKSFLV